MRTITAKDLRDNLKDISQRVAGGEHIIVSYREKPVFKLQPIGLETSKKQLSGLQAYLNAPKKKLPSKMYKGDVKKAYHEALDQKYAAK